jgi:hypothetical protein
MLGAPQTPHTDPHNHAAPGAVWVSKASVPQCGVTNVSNRTVAALYVDPNGVYSGLPNVEVWDETRDARTYAGPHPVVAHPSCQKWCQLAPLNASRIDGYFVGDDGGCFAAALNAVRAFGGVLEHPAESYAWPAFDLPRPRPWSWQRSLLDDAWVTEVSQVAYGHEARKRTWLYCVGVTPPVLDWREPRASKQVSAFGLTRAAGSRWSYATALDKGKSSYTPPAFRDVLLQMARSATPPLRVTPILVRTSTAGTISLRENTKPSGSAEV